MFSPLVVVTSPEHEELKHLAKKCINRQHSHFAAGQWRLFEKENPRRVKPLLYVYRVLLTGIHLMRTGQVEANLVTLNEEYKLPYIPELIARKLNGPEKASLTDKDFPFYEAEYNRLQGVLSEALEQTNLPEVPDDQVKGELHELLVRMRLGQLGLPKV